MNVIITGATGFVGSNLLRRILELGWQPYIILRNESDTTRIKDLQSYNVIYEEELDNIHFNHKIDVCFHLAAYGVKYNNNDVSDMIEGNIYYGMKILRFCKTNNVKRFIHTGSCFEYGDIQKKTLNENDTIDPLSFYGSAKAACDILMHTYARDTNINYVNLRLFGVYGEFEGEYRLIPQLIKSGLYEEPLKLTKGEQIRDYLYISDVIDAYIKAATIKNLSHRVYNVCSGKGVEIREIIDYISKLLKVPKGIYLVGERNYRNDELMYQVGDNTRFMQKTGWKPKVTIEKGLEKTCRWFLDRNFRGVKR